MYVPPTDPRDRPATKQPTWRNVLESYALIAAVAAALWLFSNPVTGAVLLTAIAGLALAGRRAVTLARCARNCRRFAVDLLGDVRLTITKSATEPGLLNDAATDTDLSNDGAADTTRATCC